MNNSNNPGELTSNILSCELDFLTLVESEYRPPIAFKSKQDLESWMSANGVMPHKIGRRSLDNVLVAHGRIPMLDGFRFYTQVWAKASYRDYRGAIRARLKVSDNYHGNPTSHDVDHAVSKAYLDKHWPEAWVNIMFVDRGINRSIGSMMEKLLPAPHGNEILFNAECLLKLFYRRMGNLRSEMIKEYLMEAAERFLNDASTLDGFQTATAATIVLNDISNEFEDGFSVRKPKAVGLVDGQWVEIDLEQLTTKRRDLDQT